MASEEIVSAVKELFESAKERNFTETVEISFNLKDVDLSVPKNRVNLDILLPKGRGKEVKVALFGSGELAVKAKGVADMIIFPEEIEDLADDKKKAKKLARDYQFFIAEAPLMPVIGKRLGIVLAPRGKMPKPIPPGGDPAPMVKNLRSTVRLRSKDKRTFHAPVGTKTMSPEDVAENVESVIKRLTGVLERGKFNISSAYLKTTMGPSVKLM